MSQSEHRLSMKLEHINLPIFNKKLSIASGSKDNNSSSNNTVHAPDTAMNRMILLVFFTGLVIGAVSAIVMFVGYKSINRERKDLFS